MTPSLARSGVILLIILLLSSLLLVLLLPPSINIFSLFVEYVSRLNVSHGKKPLTMHDVVVGMVKAYEIQGIISVENSFNRVGLDHGTR